MNSSSLSVNPPDGAGASGMFVFTRSSSATKLFRRSATALRVAMRALVARRRDSHAPAQSEAVRGPRRIAGGRPLPRDRRRRCCAPSRPDGSRCKSSRRAVQPYAQNPPLMTVTHFGGDGRCKGRGINRKSVNRQYLPECEVTRFSQRLVQNFDRSPRCVRAPRPRSSRPEPSHLECRPAVPISSRPLRQVIQHADFLDHPLQADDTAAPIR